METTEFRLSAVERAVGDIRTAIDRIADAMAQIARLEEKHTETVDAEGDEIRMVFPLVLADMWCGQFARRVN